MALWLQVNDMVILQIKYQPKSVAYIMAKRYFWSTKSFWPLKQPYREWNIQLIQ